MNELFILISWLFYLVMIITTHWLDLLLDYLPGPKTKNTHKKTKMEKNSRNQNKSKHEKIFVKL